MWETKTFKTEASARDWMAANAWRYQSELIFIHNGYAVEYRRLRAIRLPR